MDKAKDTIQKLNESAKEVASKTLEKRLRLLPLRQQQQSLGWSKGQKNSGATCQNSKPMLRKPVSGLRFTANEALLSFNAISGETDSSIEAISNLLQAGFNDNNLAQAVDALSGAVVKFPDTLKIESLADSLQETIATSAATGQFGELLERLESIWMILMKG